MLGTRESHRGIVLFVGVAIVLAACSWSGEPRSSGTPTESAAPTSVTLATPSATATTTPTAPPVNTPRCHSTQLQVAYVYLRGLAGRSQGTFELRNASSAPCHVSGYAGIVMLDEQGRLLPTMLTLDQSMPANEVVLRAGTAPLASGNSEGHAFFNLIWITNCNRDPTNTPAKWQITPPNEQTPLIISAQPPAGGQALAVCQNALTVQPIQPAVR